MVVTPSASFTQAWRSVRPSLRWRSWQRSFCVLLLLRHSWMTWRPRLRCLTSSWMCLLPFRRGLTSLLSFQVSGSLPPCQPWPASWSGPSESRQAPSPLWRRALFHEGFVFLLKGMRLKLQLIFWKISRSTWFGGKKTGPIGYTADNIDKNTLEISPSNTGFLFQTFMTCVFWGGLQSHNPKKHLKGHQTGVTIWHQPNTMHYYNREIPQNYHRFASSFIPPKWVPLNDNPIGMYGIFAYIYL